MPALLFVDDCASCVAQIIKEDFEALGFEDGKELR
jgi:hypothetical protein